MNKKNIVFIALVVCLKIAFSQQMVRGTVYESELGEKLKDVTIMVDGTDICSTTDSTGTYKITVPGEKSYLVFIKNDFDKLYVKVRRNYEINVVMASTIPPVRDVDVGYGSQRSTEVTGAVSNIGGGGFRPRSYVESTKKIKLK